MEDSRTQPVSIDQAAAVETTSSSKSPTSSQTKLLPAEEQGKQQPAAEDTDTAKTQSKGKSRRNNKDNQQKKPKMPPKPTPTHFLCIPLVTASSRPLLTRSLATFREEVTVPSNPNSAYGALPVPEEAIRPVGTIHLTLGVMSFLEPKPLKGARQGHGHGHGRDGQQHDGSEGRSGSRERSRSGSRSDNQDQTASGSLSGLKKLEEAKALLKTLKLREIWQEVLRQSQTQTTAVPTPQDSASGGAPLAIGTAEEKGEGVEAGPGTVVRDVQPQPQPSSQLVTTEEGKELRITLKGLHSMQPPSKATVLYAPPVDPQGHLQLFCEKVKNVFVQRGLMMEEGGRPLLLHATVVNTIYVKGRNSGRGNQQHEAGGGNRGASGGGKKGHHGHRGGHRKERLTIDAREKLERYEDYVWMEDVKVEKVAICKMGAKKELGVGGTVVDETYEVEEEVEF